MGRIYGFGGKQHHGKTVAACAAAPYACAFVVDPTAFRDMIETRLGIRPIAAVTDYHKPNDNLLGVPAGMNAPKIQALLESRIGSIDKPASACAKSPSWDASVKAAVAAGVDKSRAFFWSPPSAHEGELARVWLPHGEIIIDDWQFIVSAMADANKGAILDSRGEVDSMKIGAVLGVPVNGFFRWLEQQPISVILTSHLKKPGKVRDGVEIDAGSIVMPTRTGTGSVISTFEMVVLMRPAAATVERVSTGAMGVNVTGGKVGSELAVIDADDELDFDAWRAKPATVLEGLEDFSNLFVYFPTGDVQTNNWLTRDRSGVTWPGGCPGALYGLYVGRGKAAQYPFKLPRFVVEAAQAGVKAQKAEDLYRIVAAALQADPEFAPVLTDDAAGSKRLALCQWALHEAHAAWVAAAHWRAKEERVLGRFL